MHDLQGFWGVLMVSLMVFHGLWPGTYPWVVA